MLECDLLLLNSGLATPTARITFLAFVELNHTYTIRLITLKAILDFMIVNFCTYRLSLYSLAKLQRFTIKYHIVYRRK